MSVYFFMFHPRAILYGFLKIFSYSTDVKRVNEYFHSLINRKNDWMNE